MYLHDKLDLINK